jgi:hypothetical protein
MSFFVAPKILELILVVFGCSENSKMGIKMFLKNPKMVDIFESCSLATDQLL